MDRSKAVGQIISTFSSLANESNDIFSSESIASNANILVEEYFEQKFNPFIRKLKTEINNLPLDDYSIIEIDKWIRILSKKTEETEGHSNPEEYAEALYIRKEYYPKLSKILIELKLELIEKLFEINIAQEKSIKSNSPLRFTNQMLEADAAAFLITQLVNFGIIRQDLDHQAIFRVLAPMLGFEEHDVSSKVEVDKISRRLETYATKDSLDQLRKVLKSILARIDNQIQKIDN